MNQGINALCLIGLLLAVLAIATYANRRHTRQELRNAYNEYQTVLTLLRSQPADPLLHKQALDCGRFYSYLTHRRRGITAYDEMSLMNDINVAKATGTTSVATRTVSDRELFQQGVAAHSVGDYAQSADLFAQALSQNPNHPGAWHWLSSVLNEPEQKKYCLQQVLRITPRNDAAQHDLEALYNCSSVLPPIVSSISKYPH